MPFRKILTQFFYYYLLAVTVLFFFLAISAFYFIYDGSSVSHQLNMGVDASAKSSAFWMCIVLAYQLFALLLIIVFRRGYINISRRLFVVFSALIFTFLILPTLSLIIAMAFDFSKVF
jgi:hypothetical protein